jgi:hypothetical protein
MELGSAAGSTSAEQTVDQRFVLLEEEIVDSIELLPQVLRKTGKSHGCDKRSLSWHAGSMVGQRYAVAAFGTAHLDDPLPTCRFRTHADGIAHSLHPDPA